MALLFLTDNINSKFHVKHKNTLHNTLTKLCRYHNKSLGSLNIKIINDKEILYINREYLQHDYYTDIITFNYNHKNKINGDLCISHETLNHNARKYHSNYLNELYRVIIHGTLHLLNYEDKTRQQQQIMKSLEHYWLNQLNIKTYDSRI
jgi:rRNA maturation RNase YbeY